MLDPDQIALLATDLESYRVERKSSLSDQSKIEQAICAFSNDLAGTGETGMVLVGVKDNGQPAHLPITHQLMLTLTSIRSDGNILPFPQLVVYKAELQGIEIAVVEVEPSLNPPVRLRGTVRVRVGPRTMFSVSALGSRYRRRPAVRTGTQSPSSHSARPVSRPW